MSTTLTACMKAARAGGEAIRSYKPKEAATKGDKYVGHHAIVTEADYKSQEAVLDRLTGEHAFFITEEHVKNPDFQSSLIRSNNLELMNEKKVYIIDELDGSSSFNIGHYEWSISVGCVDRMEHVSGAIYAPKIEGGLLFYGSKKGGAFVQKSGVSQQIKVSSCKDLSNAYVLYGPDAVLSKYPVHNKLMTTLGDKARTTNVNGSCALALGLVACGKADALVQPLQSPWDWAAGKVILEESGGKMIFYEMEMNKDELEKGIKSYDKINVVEKLEPKHYNPDERTLGFVAANGELAHQIMAMLLRLH